MSDSEMPRPDPLSLVWRVAASGDEEFILDLTFVTMREYLVAANGWDDDHIRSWLQSRNRTAASNWLIASLDGREVGALAYKRYEQGIHLQSLHVLPQEQGRGIGTAMIQRVLLWADQTRLLIALEVLKVNPSARRLYERLGFTAFREDDRFYHLRRPPTNP